MSELQIHPKPWTWERETDADAGVDFLHIVDANGHYVISINKPHLAFGGVNYTASQNAIIQHIVDCVNNPAYIYKYGRSNIVMIDSPHTLTVTDNG